MNTNYFFFTLFINFEVVNTNIFETYNYLNNLTHFWQEDKKYLFILDKYMLFWINIIRKYEKI